MVAARKRSGGIRVSEHVAEASALDALRAGDQRAFAALDALRAGDQRAFAALGDELSGAVVPTIRTGGRLSEESIDAPARDALLQAFRDWKVG
jgi:hypothetical protein